jgi:hypothetical protein
MAALIVCDDRKRIRYIYTGWPGCVHDQRVYNNSAIGRRPEEFFSSSQYLLADSGYSPHPRVIPAFKQSTYRRLSDMENAFNHRLSNIRVRVEHCIGMLKARLSSLRGLKLLIRNERDVRRCVYWIRACVTLHNLFLEDPVEAEWMEADDEDQWEQEAAGSGEARTRAEDEGKQKRQFLMDAMLATNDDE